LKSRNVLKLDSSLKGFFYLLRSCPYRLCDFP
jgi:hypothetical protein